MGQNQVGVTLTVDNAQLRKEFDDDIKALDAFSRAANQNNATAVRAVRDHIQAQRDLMTEVGASTAQMQKLDAVTHTFENRVLAAGERTANATERMGRGLSMVARQGEATGRSLNTIIAAGSDLAFAFGPEGAIISGVLMVTAGIIEHFEDAESKMEETVQKFNHNLNDMLLNDSPVAAARAAGRAYVDELEKLGKLKSDADRAADKGLFHPASLGDIAASARIAFGIDADAASDAASTTDAARNAAQQLASFNVHDAQLKQLERERKDANDDIAHLTGRIQELKAEGKSVELDAAKRDLSRAQHDRDQAEANTRRMEADRNRIIDQAIAREKDPARRAALGQLKNDENHAPADFVAEHAETSHAIDRQRGDASLQAAAKSDAERKRLDDQRVRDAQRASEMLTQINDTAAQKEMEAHDLVYEAQKAAADREFHRQADEIDKLKISEDKKAELLIAAARERAEAIEAIERRQHDQVQAEILRAVDENLRTIKAAHDKEVQAEQKKEKAVEDVVRSGVDELVRGREDLGKRLLKAMLEPEVKHLEALATKEFALAIVDAAALDFAGAARHGAAGGALVVAAAGIEAVAGGGGSAGGSRGGGSGGSGGPGGGYNAAQLGTQSTSSQPLKIEFVATIKQDDRTVARTRQMIQRLDDKGQPVRVTL